MTRGVFGRRAPRGRAAVVLATGLAVTLSGCGGDESGASEGDEAASNDPAALGMPALHHVGLNSVDPDAAIDWYLTVWPSAERTELAGKPAVRAEMFLVFNAVDEPPPGAFDPELGRPQEQSPFWHIGGFLNTTDERERLAAEGIDFLLLRTGPDDTEGVWRSGLTPYQGILTADRLADAEAAEPREGGFSYLLAPDGVLFELTGGANTTPAMAHVHFFREAPQCAANWYVEHMGMQLPPIRNEDGSTSERPLYEPCAEGTGPAGWPSLETVGTIRQPRGTVIFANGSMGWYPRQCVRGRCGADQPLVRSRGQALDHVAFTVEDLDAWVAHLGRVGVPILEPVHDFGDSRAFMFEDPDGLAVELIEAEGAPPVVPRG